MHAFRQEDILLSTGSPHLDSARARLPEGQPLVSPYPAYDDNMSPANGYRTTTSKYNNMYTPVDIDIEATTADQAHNVAELVRQQGSLTKLLLEHHLKASLPQRNIEPFTGDPLEYASFMRSFEYTIEQRATNDQDKLYYLDEYTVGEPNVRSCMYLKQMDTSVPRTFFTGSLVTLIRSPRLI